MRKTICFLVCCISGFIARAQTPADSVPQDYNGLRETVYLQTSKGVYETGEDLWFKAYAFDAQTLALSDRSRTLFVEMEDGRDSIVWQEKYPIHQGLAEGHIYVDKDLRPGDYRIHAYTRHSFLRDTLMPVYPKVIRVVKEIADKLEHKETADKPNTVVRLRFFPEGGDLIDGIPSKVAFKATDEQGMPASAEGVLVEDGRVVAQLKSLHDGMGFFFLTPHKASSYKAVLDDGSGTPRQILSGIHKFYEPEQLVGKTVVAILNLPPRKMMGQMSNGMLLSAVREVEGKEELHLLILDDSVPAGSRLC